MAEAHQFTLPDVGEGLTEAEIVRWLVKHNYTDDDISKVLGGNIMRVLHEVWWR